MDYVKLHFCKLLTVTTRCNFERGGAKNMIIGMPHLLYIMHANQYCPVHQVKRMGMIAIS